MFDALRNFITNNANQREQLPGQISNNAGGYSYMTNDWTQLVRFLILGTTRGSYYVGERDLTVQNLEAIERCIAEDAERVVALVREVSTAGRALKNDPALFVLAMVASKQIQVEVKGKLITVPTAGAKAAYAAIPEVARTFTHLSHFVTFVRKGKMRGWGRGFRKAIARWFTMKSTEALAYQAIKYHARDGFSQKEVAWLCHAGCFLAKNDAARRAVFDYLGYKAKRNASTLGLNESDLTKLRRIDAARLLLQATDESKAAAIVREYDLPMEIVPTQLRGKEIYEAVAANATLGWLLRNLGNLGKVGLLTIDNHSFAKGVCKKLTDQNSLYKARLHPLSIFIAFNTYKSGRGYRSKGVWPVVPSVLDALDEAFYASFRYVRSSGKRILIAIDVSGSMRGTHVHGVDDLCAHEASAVLALVAAYAESNFHCVAFDTDTYPLNISRRQRLDDVMQRIAKTGGGGTDCAQPFIYATRNKLNVDLFVCLTDSETWAGKKHVMPALRQYRESSGIEARAINIAMTANRVSNFDADPLCLEISGFDTTIPEVISLFSNESAATFESPEKRTLDGMEDRIG